jgi:hypothetical protein
MHDAVHISHAKQALSTSGGNRALRLALMLLYMSTGILIRWSGFGWTAQMAEDFPHHEALEAANDLGLGLSFRRAASDVVDRGLVAAQAHDDHV